MQNSYCGKRCDNCVNQTEGKCYGCKPEAAFNRSPGNKVITNADDSDRRYCTYCPIAMCCRKNNYDNCGECDKRYACADYMGRVNMDSVIEAKLYAWGVRDYGLSGAVKYLWVLFFCFMLLIIPDIAGTYNGVMTIVYLPLAGVMMYTYGKMVPFSPIFRVTVLLTGLHILIRILINIIDYGRYVNSGLLLIGLIISVINYKITFDAYADMVSDASDVQERRWLRLWPASVVVYVAAAIISLSFRVNIAAIVPAVLMDIVIMANILLTISVCKQNDKGT